MKKSFLTLLTLAFLTITSTVSAQSYVLPYPSSMPGSRWYAFDRVQEFISAYWHFGNFSSFKNDLYYSDKYLVEAKTLFEYDQHLLAVKALDNSDKYFKRLEADLQNAAQNTKDITEKQILLKNASMKHVEVLEDIKEKVPESFNWTPEKDAPTNLYLHKAINNSISLREV